MASGLLFFADYAKASAFYNATTSGTSENTSPSILENLLDQAFPQDRVSVKYATTDGTTSLYTIPIAPTDSPGNIFQEHPLGWSLYASFSITLDGSNLTIVRDAIITDTTVYSDGNTVGPSTTTLLYVLLPVDKNAGLLFFNSRFYADKYLMSENLAPENELLPSDPDNTALGESGTIDYQWSMRSVITDPLVLDLYSVPFPFVPNTFVRSPNNSGWKVIASVSSKGGGGGVLVTSITDTSVIGSSETDVDYQGNGTSLYVLIPNLLRDELNRLILIKDVSLLNEVLSDISGAAIYKEVYDMMTTQPYNPISPYTIDRLKTNPDIDQKRFFFEDSLTIPTSQAITSIVSSSELTQSSWLVIGRIGSVTNNINYVLNMNPTQDNNSSVSLTYEAITDTTRYTGGASIPSDNYSLYILMAAPPPIDNNKGMLFIPSLAEYKDVSWSNFTNLNSNSGNKLFRTDQKPLTSVTTYAADNRALIKANTYLIPTTDYAVYVSGLDKGRVGFWPNDNWKIFTIISSSSENGTQPFTPANDISTDITLYNNGEFISSTDDTSLYVLVNITENNSYIVYIANPANLSVFLLLIKGPENEKPGVSSLGTSSYTGVDYRIQDLTSTASLSPNLETLGSSGSWQNVRKISSTYDGTTRVVTTETVSSSVYQHNNTFNIDGSSLYIFVSSTTEEPPTESTSTTTEAPVPVPNDNTGILFFSNTYFVNGNITLDNILIQMGLTLAESSTETPLALATTYLNTNPNAAFLSLSRNIPGNDFNAFFTLNAKWKLYKVIRSESINNISPYTIFTTVDNSNSYYVNGGNTGTSINLFVLVNTTKTQTIARALFLPNSNNLPDFLGRIATLGNAANLSTQSISNYLAYASINMYSDNTYTGETLSIVDAAQNPQSAGFFSPDASWSIKYRLSSTLDAQGVAVVSSFEIAPGTVYTAQSTDVPTDGTSFYIIVNTNGDNPTESTTTEAPTEPTSSTTEAPTEPTESTTEAPTSTSTTTSPTSTTEAPTSTTEAPISTSQPTTTQAPCFLAGAMVHTDQGIKPIETIDAKTHTIGGKRIVAITADRNPNARLVILRKDLIAENVPDRDTLITVWHKVLYREKFIIAGQVPGLKSRPYKGEILYNVLLDTHETMLVNNMVCRTMPPEHQGAQKYRM